MFGFNEDEILAFHQKIAQNVKMYRKRKNFTQFDLAFELGLKNSSFISHAENSNMPTHHYSIEHLYKISKILEIDIELLLK